MRKRGFLYKVKKYRLLLIMIAPMTLYALLFDYVPMFGAALAFKSYDYSLGILYSPFVGLRNFEFLFISGKGLLLVFNTLYYNLLFMITGTILQVFVAVVLSEMTARRYKKFCQSCMFLPYFVSWVVVGSMAYNLLNYRYGFVNTLLRGLNLETVNLYAEPSAWPFILTAFNTWKGLGYGSVIYLAAIMGIDSEIYEAAQIDGASLIRRIRHITIPCLTPTIITLTLLSVGGIFRGNFQLFYNLIGNNGYLYNATDVIDTYVFRSLMKTTEFGMTTSAGLFQSVMCFVMIVTVNGIVKKINASSALF